MTRLAVSQRSAAAIMAVGSFLSLAGATSAVRAEAPAVTPATQIPGLAKLNIAPLRIEIDSTKPTATLMLTNVSERPIPVQSRLFAWSQEGGEDRFQPSTALTISPAIISIAPGATQIVRLLRTGAASPGEKRFRLAVDQLPDPTMAQSGQAEARLRFTIPVFFDRDTAAPAKLEWRLRNGKLEVANGGGSTSRILEVAVKTAQGTSVPVERNSLRYVQGGSAIAWPVANACGLGQVTVTAQVDGKTASATASPTCG